MNIKPLTLLKAALTLAMVAGLSLTIWHTVNYRKADATYSAAEQVAGISRENAATPTTAPEEQAYIDPYAEALGNVDLAALREVNSDVVGWIDIPETEVSYPILQTGDNEYYLNHTWEKEWNMLGSIFLECQAAPDFSDFNIIVYGHNMLNDAMFGSLENYEDIAHWEAHPSVYIVNDSGAHRYDIFAAYEVGLDEITYGLNISSRPKKQEFIQFSLDQSVIDTGIVPNTLDQVLTLSTCTEQGYSTRWVVQAVLRDGEAPPGGE